MIVNNASAPARNVVRCCAEGPDDQIWRKARHHANRAKTIVEGLKEMAKEKRVGATRRRERVELA